VVIHGCVPGIEAYLLFQSITSLVNSDKLFYLVLTLGLAVPITSVAALLPYSLLTGAEVFLRRYPEGTVCMLTYKSPFQWVQLAPLVGFLIFNIIVTTLAVRAAYKSAAFRCSLKTMSPIIIP
jgi:hypothetical protein